MSRGDSLRRMLVAALRWLPDMTLLHLQNNTRLVRPVDYPNREIFLNIRSAVEYHLRLKSCWKEPDTIEWIERYFTLGEVLYDVGANVGVYSLVAAHVLGQSGQVFAFEPGFANYAQLCANVALNPFAEIVTTFPIALAARTGLEQFRYTATDSGAAGHSLTLQGIEIDGRPGGYTQSVLVYRLDDFRAQFGLPSPNHLKIDVDGAELAIVQGAAQTLGLPALRTVCLEADDRLPENSQIGVLLAEHGFEQVRKYPRMEDQVFNYYFVRR